MLSSIPQKDECYDVVVVGASFAGLSFASVGAALGLRVLVVERDAKVGGVVRTTGVFFNDVLDILDVPDRYLMNAVRRVHVQAPNQVPLDIAAQAYRFYMADVPGVLQWMAEQAMERGAEIRCGVKFQSATRDPNGTMHISLANGAQSQRDISIAARFVIGADGTRSPVAKSFALGQNTRYLAGAEWLIDNVPLDGETFYLVMDQQLAPGYCVWLAPHGSITALGVAGHPRTFSPTTSLRVAQTLFQNVADLSNMHVVERKAGTIPTGGRLKHVYRNDELGRVLLLGDAAGLCGAATGGGIYPALISGRLAAHAVASEVLNNECGAVRAYLRNLSHANRLGDYLRIEDWLRWVLDSMRSNDDVGMLYGLFQSEEGQQVLQKALLSVPIIGMDSNFFALMRSLLGKHPRLYRSALRAVSTRVGLELQKVMGLRPLGGNG